MTVPAQEALLEAHEWASLLYHNTLISSAEGETARAYIRKRGVIPETAHVFRLGYSPEDPEWLSRRARKVGIEEKVLHAAGLIFEREHGRCYIDRFRGRLMFPITDVYGRVIAFGGRAFGDEQPTYTITSETAIFSKAQAYYGVNLLRSEARTVSLVEGYFDVILPYQAGLRGLVATMGTVPTREGVRVLKNYASRVLLAFDGDEIGRRATERTLDACRAVGLAVGVVHLPSGMDPDDVVRGSQGSATLEDLFTRAE